MYLTKTDVAGQLERFVDRLEEDTLREIARPVDEAMAFAWRMLGYKASPPWLAIDAPEEIRRLRGFVLFMHIPGIPILKFQSEQDPSKAPTLVGRYYFLAQSRKLYRFIGAYERANRTLYLRDRETPPLEELALEHPGDPSGPLGFCTDLMLRQFAPMLEASRRRVAVLERFLDKVTTCRGMNADEIRDYELVVGWNHASNEPRRVRDVVRHGMRNTFLVREWEVGSAPHSIVEYETVDAAVKAVNDKPGFLRRRLR
jgi:hypothetical protein